MCGQETGLQEIPERWYLAEAAGLGHQVDVAQRLREILTIWNS